MLNVVRLVQQFPSYDSIRYGLQSTFYYLTEEQVKLGLNVHVIANQSPNQPNRETINGIHIHRVAKPYNLMSLTQLYKLSRQLNIEIIHSHATIGLSYSLLHRLLDRINAPRLVTHVHGTTKGIALAFQKTSWRHLERTIIREQVVWDGANALIANSQFLKEELIRLYAIPRKKIFLVNNGVNLGIFRYRESKETLYRTLGISQRASVILYLGGSRPVKGPTYLLKALKKIEDKHENIITIFVKGAGPLDIFFSPHLEKELQRFQRKKKLVAIDSIPHTELPQYYSAVDAVVVPSLYDAFPKVVLEAVTCGTPVVGTAVGGIPEMIKNNENGYLVKPADSDELANMIIRTVSNTRLKEQLRKKSSELQQRYSWKTAAEAVSDVYQKIL
jgi:glycosyltransferase involved in cell wall biosynthesis